VAKDADDQGLEDADYDEGETRFESVSSTVVDSVAQQYQSRHPPSSGRSKGNGNSYEAAPGSPTDRFILREEGLMHDSSHHQPSLGLTRSPSEHRPQIYLSEPIWPLTNASEARLFRHFVQKLAIWVTISGQVLMLEMLTVLAGLM
jgi:hypothetical protein